MRRPAVNVPVASGNDWGNDGFGFFFQRNWSSQPANTRPRTWPILSTDATALVVRRGTEGERRWFNLNCAAHRREAEP